MKKNKLLKEPKIKTGFATPEGYFEELSSEIISKIKNQKEQINPKFKKRKRWFYAAAAVIIVLLTVGIFTPYSTNQKEIELETLEYYIAYQSNISEEDIINLLSKEDIDEINFDFDLSKSEIENALNLNP